MLFRSTIKDSFFLNVESPSFECNKLSNKFLISNKINNFYLSDPISQASPTMAKCSKQLLIKNPFVV